MALRSIPNLRHSLIEPPRVAANRSPPLFQRFERLVHPYPDDLSSAPPKSFVAFLWACSRGVRPYLAWVTLCTAAIGAFEALLFSMMAHVVDLLAKLEPALLWQRHGSLLALLGGVLLLSIAFAGLQALF